METLVASQHKHQYFPVESGSQGLARLGSSPPNKFREINCQTFHAEDGILPTPIRASSISLIKQTPPSQKAPASSRSAELVRSKPSRKSNAIPITAKATGSEKFCNDGFFGKGLSFSERWAGPTYSNSPPPSSLPMPKFLQLPQRTKSLDLPSLVCNDDALVYPLSKSAPASPIRGFSPLSASKDSATETLRRILNLEPSDE